MRIPEGWSPHQRVSHALAMVMCDGDAGRRWAWEAVEALTAGERSALLGDLEVLRELTVRVCRAAGEPAHPRIVAPYTRLDGVVHWWHADPSPVLCDGWYGPTDAEMAVGVDVCARCRRSRSEHDDAEATR